LDWKNSIKLVIRGILDPVVSLIHQIGVPPVAVTITGVLISLAGALVVAAGHLFTGAVILLISGLCDIIDGSLARKGEKVTVFGAFIDSTGDRLTELAYFGGLIFYYLRAVPVSRFHIFFLLVALAGSILTSYTRARAEGLGMECTVGLMERPERIALLIVGLALNTFILTAVILVLAVLTVFTFMQRIIHVRRLSAEKDM
jgi:CDP-diacylglycerol--glycerol-3-phosphate 3-phosphatidyltransferase